MTVIVVSSTEAGARVDIYYLAIIEVSHVMRQGVLSWPRGGLARCVKYKSFILFPGNKYTEHRIVKMGWK